MIQLWFQPKPLLLLNMIEKEGKCAKWLGYGGARGGGKSRCCRDAMLARRIKYPGTKGMIFRRVWDEVRDNHLMPMLDEHPELRELYNNENHEITLDNGSVIRFMYAESIADIRRKFVGPEYMDVFIDQAEQLSEQELGFMEAVCRDPKAKTGQCKFVLFFNPGGVGTEFLRRIFWTRNNWKSYEDPENFNFIQAKGWDNYEWVRMSGLDITQEEWYEHYTDAQRFTIFINDTSYGRTLNSMPQSIRAGWLLGSFDSFEGQYYSGVWDENKIVLPMTDVYSIVQPWWVGWKAMDWGMAHGSAIGWAKTGKMGVESLEKIGIISEKPMNCVIIHRELIFPFDHGQGEIEIGKAIAKATPEDERKTDKHFFLSPDAKAKRSSANTIKDQLAMVMRVEGLPAPENADDERKAGWRLIWNMLRFTCQCRNSQEIFRATEDQVFPLLFISAVCTEIIAAFPLMIRDTDKDAEDVKKTATLADDVMDMVRYLLKTFFAPRSKAPVAVRAMEVYNDPKYHDNTARALAIREFHSKEKSRMQRVSRGQRR